MELTGLTTQKLRQAADLQERIESLQQQLSDLLTGGTAPKAQPVAASVATKGKRGGPRNISAAGRARIAAAARARWAKYNQEKSAGSSLSAAPAMNKPQKRRLSAAGRAAISAAAKARWAKQRGSGK